MVKIMNEELIRECAREAEEGTRGASVGEVREAAEQAIRLYYDRAVEPLVEALRGIADHPGPYADESAWSRVESAKEALARAKGGEVMAERERING